jgi:hypothetical protein
MRRRRGSVNSVVIPLTVLSAVPTLKRIQFELRDYLRYDVTAYHGNEVTFYNFKQSEPL